jgi:predicted N-acetyltransferase YhbS
MSLEVRVMQPADQAQILAMTAVAFSREPDEAEHYQASWLAHPGGGPGSVRVGVVGGEVVATLTVIERTLCLGRAAGVRTACIRDVTTLKAHRGQGYGARLVRGTLDVLQAEGYALAYLDGIKDFYGRFGFAPVIPFTALELQLEDVAAIQAGNDRVRRAAPEDVPALERLYAVCWDCRSGSVERTAAHWQWLIAYQQERPIWVLEGENGVPVAYAHEYLWNNLIDEWGARDVRTGLRLLRWLARELGWGGARMRLAGPLDYFLFRAVERRLPYEYEIYGHPDGGWMAAVLDPLAALTALLPELSRRWTAVPRRNAALRLVLDDATTLGLRLRRDGVTLDRPPRNAPLCQLPRRYLAPLLFGTRLVDELAGERGVRFPPAGRLLLNTLFPRAWTFLPGLDWF